MFLSTEDSPQQTLQVHRLTRGPQKTQVLLFQWYSCEKCKNNSLHCPTAGNTSNAWQAGAKFCVWGQPTIFCGWDTILQDYDRNLATSYSNDRKTLCTRIQEAAKHKKSIIIKKLSAVNYVATTTDCWSARQRSYLGVTCHWIDNTSLERHSAALACRRLKGSHTFDILAAALEEIDQDDNRQWLKLFEGLSIIWRGDHQCTRGEWLHPWWCNSRWEWVRGGLSRCVCYSGWQHRPWVPTSKAPKCACHLLNLISTVDATAAGGAANETYKKLSRSAFANCHALWNKTSRSTMAHETVERECKLQFLRPNQTRWSSLFLAVERIVRIHREQGEQAIRNVCTALKMKM